MSEETHDLKINRKTGIVTIDGKEYSAADLTYEVTDQDKVKIMIIRASNGDQYRFETQKRSFLGGYGKVGDTISLFQIDFPHAKSACTPTLPDAGGSIEENTTTIKMDENAGKIIINGIEYRASELSYNVVDDNDKMTRTLFIEATNGDSYQIQAVGSKLFGFGNMGKQIDNFRSNIETIQKAELRMNQRASILSGNIPHIDAPDGLLLKKGEFAIFTDTDVRYCQEKTKTTYYGGSARIRVCKGVSIGGGKGVPVKEEYIATLDTGRLTLTNKRIIFSGERKSTTIQLSKLVAIDRYRDAIDLTKENAVKKTMFVNIDGDLYAYVIEQLVDES